MRGSAVSAKSTLQRGRARLRELAHEPEEVPELTLTEADRGRLVKYVEAACERRSWKSEMAHVCGPLSQIRHL
jgi:hypothetical protein